MRATIFISLWQCGHSHGSGITLLELLATNLIGIPSVIAHEMKAFVWDVLGDACDEVAGATYLKIALDLGVYPRVVNDRVPEAVGLHFIDENGFGCTSCQSVTSKKTVPSRKGLELYYHSRKEMD